jgi:hypothetical protein
MSTSVATARKSTRLWPKLTSKYSEPVAVAAVTFMLLLVSSKLATCNNYSYLASAFEHGRTWIDYPGPVIDAVPYDGHYYVIEGPFPALLVLPFEMIYGASGLG